MTLRTAGLLLLASSLTIPALAQTAPPAAPQSVPAQQTSPGQAQNAPAVVQPVVPRPGAPTSFSEMTTRLQPAVVNISTTQRVEVGRFPRFGQGTTLEDLFRRFQEQQGDDGQPVTREANSLGSGFIISADGFVVTNNHVISGRDGQSPVDTITVTLSDRREFKARLVGRDILSDLAVLKIDGQNLPFVTFGNSQGARVGDWVIAIGNPFGLGGTVTAGIVSALHRNITGGGAYDRYLQTDASINQGNSGGPLFDMNGQVIGINTAIFSPTGGNVGLGFAIPAELAKPVIDQLRAGGRVRRGYLGVQIQPLSDDIARSLGLAKDRGEIVAGVEPKGPASAAGIRQGDVILRVNNQDVTVDNTLSFIVANTAIGTRIPIEIVRDGRRQTISATIAERPAETALLGQQRDDEDDAAPPAGEQQQPGAEAARQSLGITLQALTPEIRRQLRIGDDVRGVVVARVNAASDAASNDIRRGDVILSINQRPVLTPAEAAAAVAAARQAGRDTVLLLVQRGTGPSRFIGVKLQSTQR